MKKLILIVFFTAASCSNSENSCDLKKQAITDKYDAVIKKMVEGHHANEINYKQLELVKIEKSNALSKACQ